MIFQKINSRGILMSDIILKGQHGDQVKIVVHSKNVYFNVYSDGNGFMVSMTKEELKKLLENK